MKYNELLDALKGMTESQLDAEVMVFGSDVENGVCHLVAEDVGLSIASVGAIMTDGRVTDDFYGIADEADGMENVTKLLDCNQPYLMIGGGCIPTCQEG